MRRKRVTLSLQFPSKESEIKFKLAMASKGYYVEEGGIVVQPRTAFEKIRAGLSTRRLPREQADEVPALA